MTADRPFYVTFRRSSCDRLRRTAGTGMLPAATRGVLDSKGTGMATRRRKLPRKRRGRQVTAARGTAADTINTGRPSPGGLTTAVRGTAARTTAQTVTKGRRPSFAATPDAAAGRFLSPEQQYLLKKRREAEQREAKDRRTALAIILVLVLLVAGAVAGLVWLWQSPVA